MAIDARIRGDLEKVLLSDGRLRGSLLTRHSLISFYSFSLRVAPILSLRHQGVSVF